MLALCATGAAEEYELAEIMQPKRIQVDDHYLYVRDLSCNCVALYSLPEIKLIRKIGKKGEGPGEMPMQPYFSTAPGKVLLHSILKLIEFSNNGTLIREIAIPSLSSIYRIGAAGKNYVVLKTKYEGEQKKSLRSIGEIVLCDKDLEEIKILKKWENTQGRTNAMGKQYREPIKGCRVFRTWKDKIYIPHPDKGLFIEVFDSDGNLDKVIRSEYKKIRVGGEAKQEAIRNYFNKKYYTPERKAILKKRLLFKFPEFYPAIWDFIVVDDNIYIKTYEKDERNMIMFLVLDLDGKLVKSVFLPHTNNLLFYIKNKMFYYLEEDSDKETWLLKVTKI
jgi:hypothetical protein